MKGNRRPGFTQLELMLALGLFSLIFLLCAQLFTTSWQRFHILNVVQDVKMNGIRGMEKFAGDFNETSVKHIIKSDDALGLTQYICFPSRRMPDGSTVNDTGNTNTIWRTWLIYYLIPAIKVNSGNLATTLEDNPGGQKDTLYYLVRKRKTIPGSESGNPSLDEASEINPERGTLAPVMTNPLRGTTTGGEVVARNVTLFSVDTEHSGAVDTYKAVIVTYGSYQGKKCSSKVERVFLIQNI